MIQAIVVDDERPSADKMAKLLTSSSMVEVREKFTDPREALEYISKTKLDAAFLDIEMPDMDGFELAHKMLDLQGRMAVVFVTAYNEYAVEAFRINALDYLMKPVDKDRLQETLNRIIQEKNIKMHTARLQVQCFNKFKITNGDEEIKFRTSKAEELMAYLIDHWGEEVSRTKIIDQLWTEYDGDRAVDHFNTTLYYVRKALLRSGIDVTIEHSRGSYRLNTKSLGCDYFKFISFIRKSSPINRMNIEEYEKAVLLYTGDYLENHEFKWAVRNRILIKEKYIQMILDMAAYYKSVGKYRELIQLLISGLQHEPLHTAMNYILIETLVETNDRLTAEKYYDIYRTGLKNELGLKPDSRFKKIINQMR